MRSVHAEAGLILTPREHINGQYLNVGHWARDLEWACKALLYLAEGTAHFILRYFLRASKKECILFFCNFAK
jgi:hypothetical protein